MILITYNSHKSDPLILALGDALEKSLKHNHFFKFLKLNGTNNDENSSLIKHACNEIEKITKSLEKFFNLAYSYFI